MSYQSSGGDGQICLVLPYSLRFSGLVIKRVLAQLLSCVRLFATPWTVACQAPPSMGILQARITGVGSHTLLQDIFLTQGSNWSLLHCRQILYQLSQHRSPIKRVRLQESTGRRLSAPEGKEFGLFFFLAVSIEPIDYLAHNKGSINTL